MGIGHRAYDATVGRLFAGVYDRLMADTEEAGLSDHRHGILAEARGRTVELGAGTGLNLAHYPDGVDKLGPFLDETERLTAALMGGTMLPGLRGTPARLDR